ncbi:hypothetical protein [Halobacterium litoreum]|uniref:ATP-binding protein n=1 Tax=Halobacterium litoreum TaxID=2039234 RepID=A0ABD5NID2_9EURY|nr:hypothetical protein [Halobacterium litoreum]UHH12417.1 hypothetical protein LT972_09630 [Halobacterium litoreum]
MSGDDGGGDDLYTPAQFREHQDGHGDRDAEAHTHTGLTRDERLSRFLSVVEAEYDPTVLSDEKQAKMPGRAEQTTLHERTRRMEATETARRALDGGDMQTLKHLTGDTGQRADVSGLKAIKTLESFLTGPAPMFYEWAEPGTGKSNFALLLGQLWKREHPSGLVASNVRTLRETDEWTDAEGCRQDGWLSNFEQLEAWMEQDGDPMHNDQTPKLFIFDEASSSAGGSGSSGYQTKTKMGPMAYKIRKYGGSLIVIGHDGKDVHPLIREMGVCVHKEALKRATFYEDVKNRRGVEPIASVDGIPETDWRYDDKEATTWSWSDGDDEDGETAPADVARRSAIATVVLAKEAEPEKPNREIAEFVPYSTEWVRQRWNEYEQDGKHREVVGEVTDLTA